METLKIKDILFMSTTFFGSMLFISIYTTSYLKRMYFNYYSSEVKDKTNKLNYSILEFLNPINYLYFFYYFNINIKDEDKEIIPLLENVKKLRLISLVLLFIISITIVIQLLL